MTITHFLLGTNSDSRMTVMMIRSFLKGIKYDDASKKSEINKERRFYFLQNIPLGIQHTYSTDHISNWLKHLWKFSFDMVKNCLIVFVLIPFLFWKLTFQTLFKFREQKRLNRAWSDEYVGWCSCIPSCVVPNYPFRKYCDR